MKGNMIKIPARSDEKVLLKVTPGHFAGPQSHLTHYLDLTTIKTRCSEAAEVATALSTRYEISVPVDTIVCVGGMEVVGAFLAENLSKAGVLSLNAHKTIYVVSTEFDNTGQMIFRDNIVPMIKDKNVVVLMGTISSGITLQKAMNSVLYYGGKISGVSAVFSAINSVAGLEVNALYYKKDIPGYETYKPTECPACRRKEKIEAMVNSYGYSEL